MTGRGSAWWACDRHADRRPFLIARNAIKSAIRRWFEDQGFTEVEPACLQVSPGNEAHLHAFKTELIGTDQMRQPRYLHTSPEFACKKLLAAGETRIFTFAPVFRNRERGALHASEFTMLEWYRAGEPYTALMEDCSAILRLAAATVDNRFVSYRGQTCNPRAEPERLSVAEAFSRHAGINLLGTLDEAPQGRDRFAGQAALLGLRIGDDDTWSDIFSRVLAAHVEPRLGVGRPTVLFEYPACEAALARLKGDDPRVAERFEIYLCGVELANGFSELTDPIEQRRRFLAEMALKEARYGERYPLDEDFLAALSYMPPASGCALGFDRLVMLATGADRVAQVQWTPATEPGNE